MNPRAIARKTLGQANQIAEIERKIDLLLKAQGIPAAPPDPEADAATDLAAAESSGEGVGEKRKTFTALSREREAAEAAAKPVRKR